MNHFLPNITDLLHDPDLGAQSFTILRSSGKWERGEYKTSVERIPAHGNIQPASAHTMSQFPQGDRPGGELVAWSTTEIKMADPGCEQVSDEIEWNGHKYKVLRVEPWLDFGFCTAYLTRKE